MKGARHLVYPGRKVHDVLPQGAGTNVINPLPSSGPSCWPSSPQQHPAGRSLRELTGRTQRAIRRPLDDVGIPRRGPGAVAIKGA
jgi:hypothetical protein